MGRGLALAWPAWMIALGIILEAARLRRACRCSACMCEGGKKKEFSRVCDSVLEKRCFCRNGSFLQSCASGPLITCGCERPPLASCSICQSKTKTCGKQRHDWEDARFFFFFLPYYTFPDWLSFLWLCRAVCFYISLLVDDLLSQVFRTALEQKLKCVPG